MGIKTYNPYTPSRRNMTGSDFSEVTKSTPERSLLASKKKNADVIIRVKSQFVITVVATDRNIELSTSREERMTSQLL